MVKLIESENSLNIGFPMLDNEHKELITLINKLFDSLSSGMSDIVLAKVSKELADYAANHLTHEENLMQKINYPEYQKHLAEHNTMRSKIKEIINFIQSGNGENISINILTFLTDWLKNHILTEDKKIHIYIKENNF